MRIRDYMGHKLVFLEPDDRVRHALWLVRRTRALGATLVDEEFRVTGILTRSELTRPEGAAAPLAGTVVASPSISMRGLLERVAEVPLGQALVLTPAGETVGLVTRVEILNGLLDRTVFLQSELGALLSSLPTGVIAVNQAGDVSFANPAAERMLGLEPGSLAGRPGRTLLPWIDFASVLDTGRPVGPKRVRRGERAFVVDLRAIEEGGRARGALAILQDLTEIEGIARELETTRKLHQTLDTILELAYDGIVVCDEQGRITMVNKALCEFLGLSKAELVGRHVMDVLENTRLHLVARSGVPEIGHVQVLRGQKMLVNRMPLVQDGRVVGAVGKIMFRGVGELREVARRLEKLESEVAYYKEELVRASGARYTMDAIVHQSLAMAEAKRLAVRAARSNSTVLLLGESGTGKELFAHAIHNASPRRAGPFVRVNCAAVPEHLLESEFFGYAEGAFTGARKGGKPGKFELAHGGTLFLDEIGDMSEQLQAKLLRVIQDREVERLGSTQPTPVDVRLIAASNKQLEAMVASGQFREDLYYRLNVFAIRIPPLRQRREDIPSLVRHFIQKFNSVLGTRVEDVSREVATRFAQYAWPGNVRELENVIERAMNLDPGSTIELHHLPPGVAANAGEVNAGDGPGLLSDAVADAERRAILAALEQAGGNKKTAAKLLGLSRSSLYEKLASIGLAETSVRRRG